MKEISVNSHYYEQIVSLLGTNLTIISLLFYDT